MFTASMIPDAKAALLTKFEMANRQNKIKNKKYDEWAFWKQSQGYKQGNHSLESTFLQDRL